MPEPDIKGNQLYSLLETEDSSLTIDENNRGKATLSYQGRWPDAAVLALQISRHPDFPELVRKEVSIERESPSLAKVTINFEGVVTEDPDEPGIVTKYSLRGSTSTEPIESHPKFPGSNGFGGVPLVGAPGVNSDTGAAFDEHGKFLGFMVEKTAREFYPDANRNKAGVRNYLSPGFVYSEDATYDRLAVETIQINMNNLGIIEAANYVHNDLHVANVAQKLVSKTVPFAGSSDEAGNVNEPHLLGNDGLGGGDAA